MAGERRFTRIPPEGTGDRIRVQHSIDILYNSRTGVLTQGDTVFFDASTISGTIIRVREDTATSGLISINLDSANRDKNTLPQQGENIQRLPGNTQLAKVAPGDPVDVYASVGTLVGYNDQYNGL
jgi:hypothetical protein